MFADDFLINDVQLINETIQATKPVVTCFKHSDLASQLKQVFYQEVSTKWNSKLFKLKSVYSQFELIEVLLELKKNPAMESINSKALKGNNRVPTTA